MLLVLAFEEREEETEGRWDMTGSNLRRRRENMSQIEWEITCIHNRPGLAWTSSIWSTKCFDIWSITSRRCLVCSLLLKQVGNKGKASCECVLLFFSHNSLRLCQQISKLFLKLSLQTLFTRKTCNEGKHTKQKPAAAGNFLQYFIRHNFPLVGAEQNCCKTPACTSAAHSQNSDCVRYISQRVFSTYVKINTCTVCRLRGSRAVYHTSHIVADSSGNTSV